MLNVVCVEHGNYAGRGREYVNVLFDMVRRNLIQPHRFVCFTDNTEGLASGIETRPLPGNLPGWWNKLYLFAPGHFEDGDRVLFIDLDTVILGGLDELAAYDGDFILLRDFYRPRGYGSGLMAWRAGFGEEIWERFLDAGCLAIAGGDQAWIERCVPAADTWQDKFPGRVVSYKANVRGTMGAPDGTWIICFHGEPKPHNCADPYIERFWKIGGHRLTNYKIHCNTREQTVFDQVRQNIRLDVPWMRPKMYQGSMVIVGGGPSLADTYKDVRRRQKNGAHVWAMNAVHDYLIERKIVPDFCAVLDARIHTVEFVRNSHPDVTYFVASQCHPDVFNILKGRKVVLWHAQGIENLLMEEDASKDRPWLCVGGGNSVGLRSMFMGRALGYGAFHLYGMDSSYADGKNHAYAQPLNDHEKTELVTCAGKEFLCARWMADQANSFRTNMRVLEEQGCIVTAHGSGLIPFIYRTIINHRRQILKGARHAYG